MSEGAFKKILPYFEPDVRLQLGQYPFYLQWGMPKEEMKAFLEGGISMQSMRPCQRVNHPPQDICVSCPDGAGGGTGRSNDSALLP